MTRSLAKELGPAGITVNSVAPGVILTAIHERTNTPETLEKLRLTTAAKRLGQPADCAGRGAVPGFGGGLLRHRQHPRRQRRHAHGLISPLDAPSRAACAPRAER